MASSVFAGKVASSWAKPGARTGFLHLTRTVDLGLSDSVPPQTHLRESIQAPQPRLNTTPHF